jgi:hypothetical protein
MWFNDATFPVYLSVTHTDTEKSGKITNAFHNNKLKVFMRRNILIMYFGRALPLLQLVNTFSAKDVVLEL